MNLDWVESLPREAWDDLWARNPGATPFQTWSWHQACREAFGHRPLIGVHRGQGTLQGLIPLRVDGHLWRVVRGYGWGPSDDLEGLGGAVCELAGEDIAGRYDLWDRGESSHQEAGSLVQSTRLLLTLPSDFESYLSTLSKSLRADIRRGLRDPLNQVREGTATDLPVFFHLHEARWRKRGLPGVFGERVRRLHHALWSLDPSIAKLWILERGGHPIGALYALQGQGTTYFYQSGFDPSASKFSPGTVLVAHVIRDAIERRHHTFDFCRGDEPYKRRWKPDREVTQWRTILPYTGMGRLGAAWIHRAHAVEMQIRARFEGGSLWSKPGIPKRS